MTFSWSPTDLLQAKNYFTANPVASDIYQVARQKNLTPESLANLYTSSVGGNENQILSNIRGYLSANNLSLPGAQQQTPQTYPNVNWQNQYNQFQQNYGNQGLSGIYNQQSTPQTYPNTKQQDGVTYTSGSTVNPNAPTYPTRQWDMNNFRGATYFSPQQNQYVSGGGMTTGF